MFQVTGEEQYSPRGKLYLLQIMDQIENDKELAKEFRRLLFLCAMCGRCEDVCSSDVDLLRIWHEQRARAVKAAPEEFEYLDSLKSALANVKNIYGLDPEDRAVFWLDELSEKLPSLESRLYAPGKTAEVMVFLGCLMSFRGSQMDVVEALFKSLEALGVDYLVMGAEEFCCGHPLYLIGDEHGAEELRSHNRLIIERAHAKRVITSCPGCLIQLSQYHGLEGVEVLHTTQFFDRVLNGRQIRPHTNPTTAYPYHDPCELHRIMGIKTEPRSLMHRLGVNFRELDLACCGGGGLLRMTDPNLSDKIIEVRKKSEGLAGTTVLTCCPSCREQLLGAGIKTRDIIEILAESLEGGNSR